MRRPLSWSSPSAGWMRLAVVIGRGQAGLKPGLQPKEAPSRGGVVFVAVGVVVVMGMRLFFQVELEEDAAGVFGMDVGLGPAVGAPDAAEGLDAVVADGAGGALDVGDLEGDVMEAGAALFQEAVEE